MLALATSIYGFSANCLEETKMENNQTTTVEKVTFDDVYGTCHIVIRDTKTKEIVYQTTLIANSEKACEEMLDATLKALDKGTLKPNN